MENFYVIVAIVSAFLAGTSAQVPFFGKCPPISIKSDFVPSSYLGRWYEYSKYFAIFELGGKCISATYGPVNGTTISVLNRQRNIITNSVSEIQGYATLKGPPEIADLVVVFPSSPGGAGQYRVLETDYDNYSVVYSCNEIGYFHVKFVWILTRNVFPSNSVIATATQVLEKNKIAKSLLLKTDHSGCPMEHYRKRSLRYKRNTNASDVPKK